MQTSKSTCLLLRADIEYSQFMTQVSSSRG